MVIVKVRGGSQKKYNAEDSFYEGRETRGKTRGGNLKGKTERRESWSCRNEKGLERAVRRRGTFFMVIFSLMKQKSIGKGGKKQGAAVNGKPLKITYRRPKLQEGMEAGLGSRR